ncbi:MAG TPA: histidine phosphatase family protein [Pseudolysinimonas sp.]|nr:histidine phosphatase family protein [Pseudolysinimonas sp.]
MREICLVRHGESEANVAASRAEAAGDETIAVPARDPDVQLSALGRGQARALGRRFGAWAGDGSAFWTSPYARARQTLQLAAEAGGVAPAAVRDDRLRDRELGVLDALTSRGVEARLPAEAARRRWLGKYYYRPPGGESWADVGARLRDLLRDVVATEERVVAVTHDAVVILLTAQLLGFDEAQLLEFARTHNVGNASVTRLENGPDGWRLAEFADTRHLDAEGVAVTEHPGDRDARIH